MLTGGFGGGLLNSLRQVLWVPINQRAFRRVSLDVFGHLLDLDLDFHLHRKTGAALHAHFRTWGSSVSEAALPIQLPTCHWHTTVEVSGSK